MGENPKVTQELCALEKEGFPIFKVSNIRRPKPQRKAAIFKKLFLKTVHSSKLFFFFLFTREAFFFFFKPPDCSVTLSTLGILNRDRRFKGRKLFIYNT